jgi:hypothetical protein
MAKSRMMVTMRATRLTIHTVVCRGKMQIMQGDGESRACHDYYQVMQVPQSIGTAEVSWPEGRSSSFMCDVLCMTGIGHDRHNVIMSSAHCFRHSFVAVPPTVKGLMKMVPGMTAGVELLTVRMP